MLSQEELDKLLEEGPEGSEKNANTDGEDKPAAEGMLKQEELNKLLSEEESGGKKDSDVDWGDAFAEAAAGGDAAAAKAVSADAAEGKGAKTSQAAMTRPAPHAKSAAFDEFRKPSPGEVAGGGKPDMDFILDLPLDVSVELGRSKLQIRELLQLGQGSVIELERTAGEPADIFVNHKLMAKGEVVVINEKFGIRLIEIISPIDRVKSLG
jgi:flagellar motor switch protein FliN/FliY